ncbi:MAG: hypothetical protein HY049_08140 [Acidobacteria bacterium]|nr:hypothetical protein [Acidobacteriota bacterium]
MTSARLQKLFAVASLAAYLLVLSIFKLSNNDIFIHLKLGEWILAHGAVPSADPFSFTAGGRPYVAHEWLAAVVFHLVHAAAGVNGLILFKALLVVLTAGLLVRVAFRLGATLPSILWSSILALHVASARFLERPHLFSYLFVAAYLALFFEYREGGRRRAWLYAIPLLHILWVNLHGGHVVGLLLVAVFAVGEAAERWRGRATRADAVAVAALIPATIAASLVNPYGWKLLTFPFELTGMRLYMNQILEWRPPYDPSYNTFTMFVFFVAHVVLVIGAMVLAGSDRIRRALLVWLGLEVALLILCWFQPGHPLWTPDVLAVALYALAGVLLVLAAARARTFDVTFVGIVALFLLLALRHNRGTADAALATWPILAAASPRWRRPSATVLASLAVVSVTVTVAAFGYHYNFGKFVREGGLGVTRDVPSCALDFVEREHLSGNAFVSYALAGPLIERVSPGVKVNMDSRNEVYGEDLYREYLGALETPAAMRAYLAAHPVDLFFMGFDDREAAVFDDLTRAGGFVPVYYDDRVFVLVRRNPGTEELIRREGFAVLRPGAEDAPTRVSRDNAEAALGEAERAIRDCPESRFGWFYKGRVLLFMGRNDEAVAALRELIARDPGNAHAFADLGDAHAALGQVGDAGADYERALELRPGLVEVQQKLQRLQGKQRPRDDVPSR